MTRSLYMLGAVALARTGAAVITAGRTYQLTDSFNYQNFFESFDFFQSDFNTGNYNDVDPTSGYVNYRNESEAEQLQLISTRGTEVYIGVDYNSTLDAQGEGRSSVRLESKQTFDSGLFVAKFSHLPAPVCGTWPSYWMYGSNWPADGEIDIYENWNNAATNLMSLHTGPAADVGACLLVQSEMSDPVVTPNCDNAAVGQYSGQGCGVNEVNGLWGSSTGGIYAMEWTDDAISIWSWSWGSEPSDIDGESPDPSTWGTPHLRVTSGSCNIADSFSNQKIVLDIDFCGTTAGQPGIWDPQCGTLADTCQQYVAANPGAFSDVYWQVQSIDVFQLGEPVSTTTTTSTTTTSTTATTSTSTTTSITTTSTTATTSTSTTTSTTTTSTTASTSTSTTATITDSTSPTSTSQNATGTATSTSSRAPFGNSTVTSGSATGSGSTVSLTTSTIVTTSVYTVTSCAPTVTACPVGHVTTEVITLGTTICPVTATATSSPTHGSSSSLPAGWTTSTVYTTKTYTITSCAATVTDCPARIGKVTTETVALSTTVCPIGSGNGSGSGSGSGNGNGNGVTLTTRYHSTLQATTTNKKPLVLQVTATVVPQSQPSSSSGSTASSGAGGSAGAGAGSAPYASKNSTSSAARPNGSAASAAPSAQAPGASSSGKTVVVSGGVQAGASLVMVLLGAAAAVAL